MAFAKLFETAKHGQILVMLQDGDTGPEVRFFMEPPGFGVCSNAMMLEDRDPDDWERAEAAFAIVDEDYAIQWADRFMVITNAVMGDA